MGLAVVISVSQGFQQLISKLTPSPGQFSAAVTHRAEIEACLNSRIGIYRLFETGSLSHGTGVRHYSDSDLMVSIKGERPNSDRALEKVKSALSIRYPITPIRISRPAVVCKFTNGEVEVTPAYIRLSDPASYWIPAPGGDWIISAPTEHNRYVTEVNGKAGIVGGAKYMARLMKGWKYFNAVPVSSFYLEMRSAEYVNRQSTILWIYDMYYMFRALHGHGLAAMNDPKNVSGRINPCSSDYSKRISLGKVGAAVTYAERALNYYRDERHGDAFVELNKLFNGRFPSRW
ncbi:SMODS domain-containing nucleotidyltransferase [Streptomyces cyaneofuscatus]|uniref:SMODS domain-containing nucleotidyltransferase n=1 Tax=Streptomyces cyaneofuscatus TaxID=66883 RepID=UPI003CEB488E